MRNTIAKFEALGTFNPTSVLKEFNLTINDLNVMIKDLEEYGIDPILSKELSVSKVKGYRDLRKWKVESFLGRYNAAKGILDEAQLVDDYMLELSDQGIGVKIDPNKNIILIVIPLMSTTEMKHLSILEKLNLVTTHLLHDTRRILTEFQGIEYSRHEKITLKVSYKVVGSKLAKKPIQENEDESSRRVITDIFRSMDRHHDDEEPEDDEDDNN